MRDRYASLREGLVGAWIPSISGSGLLLPDLSGQGNNGTLTNMGPEDWVSGQYGRALDFDGVNDRVGLGKALFNVQPFTATQWAYYAGSSATVSACFAQYAAGASGRLLLHYHNNDGTISFNVGGSAPNIQSPEILNSWYHVAVVRVGINYTMYINGSYVGASSDSDVIYTGTATTIGGTISGLYWLGQVDDTRIYNRALSESEIKLLASRPGIGLRPQRRSMYYAPPTGARRRRILTSMP